MTTDMQKNSLFLVLTVLAIASCGTSVLQEPDNVTPDPISAKICNTSDDAETGLLIVKFNEEAVPAIEKAAAERIATRSAGAVCGIDNLDIVLDELHAVGIERVFPVNKSTEAETRAAGLHRWYVIRFAEGQNLDEAASRLASVSEITKLQFSAKLCKASDTKVYPLSSSQANPGMIKSDFNDPQIPWQWHYINNADLAIASNARKGADIDVADAWKLTGGDPRIIVAVLDEGVKYAHPDLAANMWVNEAEIDGDGIDNDGDGYVDDVHGYNFVDDGPITWNVTKNVSGVPQSDSGHGTHVAGTVAAVNNNGIGVAGIAGGTGKGDGVRIMSCQIFSGTVSTNDYNTAKAVKYATDHGATILQCSYGYASSKMTSDAAFEQQSPLLCEALNYFFNKKNCDAIDGGIAIYAAGNTGENTSNYPGGYRECISVTAISPDYLPTYYTCYGPGCNIAAPGGETTGFSGGERAGVLSTICSELNNGEDYGYMQGTSMACPHVSGVAALGLSYALAKGKHFTRDEFISMLLTSVNDIDSRLEGIKTTGKKIDLEDYVGKMGTGLIDAYKLLMQVEGTPCVTVTAGKEEAIALTSIFGGSAQTLTYTGVSMSDADMQRLGLQKKPEMVNGKLVLTCTNQGTARITVKAIGGGTSLGSTEATGGKEITKEFSIVSRESSNGRWL